MQIAQLAGPVAPFLSEASKQCLEVYLGKAPGRQRKVQEFFKCLDWMPLADIPNPFYRQWPPSQQRPFLADIQAYLNQKQTAREKAQTQRRDYKLKVYAYFREHVSPSDKALLESLRDFELGITGSDRNWQHYFAFKSYKQIDAFIQGDGRKERIQQFQDDVAAFQKNRERLRHGLFCDAPEDFDFDDWCEWFADEPINIHKPQRTGPPVALRQACHTLDLTELPGTEADLKRQFRLMTLRTHPDVPGGSSEQMKAVLAAYELIKNHLSAGGAQKTAKH
jgi:hypothetical protein